jgi:hypothetical protein
VSRTSAIQTPVSRTSANPTSRSRTASNRASRQRSRQQRSVSQRGAAPALKNILSQLGGLSSASPWRKQRDKRGAARKPKALRIEGLERREMLDGNQGDIDLVYAGAPESRIGPAIYDDCALSRNLGR